MSILKRITFLNDSFKLISFFIVIFVLLKHILTHTLNKSSSYSLADDCHYEFLYINKKSSTDTKDYSLYKCFLMILFYLPQTNNTDTREIFKLIKYFNNIYCIWHRSFTKLSVSIWINQREERERERETKTVNINWYNIWTINRNCSSGIRFQIRYEKRTAFLLCLTKWFLC